MTDARIEVSRLLHVHGQEHPHGDVFVVGNSIGLEALRDAIDLALMDGDGSSEVSAGDGEGYFVFATLLEADADWIAAGLPYTKMGVDYRNSAVFPAKRLGPEKYTALIQEAVEQHARVDNDEQPRRRRNIDPPPREV